MLSFKEAKKVTCCRACIHFFECLDGRKESSNDIVICSCITDFCKGDRKNIVCTKTARTTCAEYPCADFVPRKSRMIKPSEIRRHQNKVNRSKEPTNSKKPGIKYIIGDCRKSARIYINDYIEKEDAGEIINSGIETIIILGTRSFFEGSEIDVLALNEALDILKNANVEFRLYYLPE